MAVATKDQQPPAPPPPRAGEDQRHGRAAAPVGLPLQPRHVRPAHRRPHAARTLAAVNWTEAELRKLSGIEQAKRAGELLAERATKAGVKTCVFDRGGYQYHGRVQALADGAREKGLSF